MPIEKSSKIWMNGELVDWDDATVHVLTHTLHYGNGVFEGIRAYETERGPAVFRLREHIERCRAALTSRSPPGRGGPTSATRAWPMVWTR